MTHPWPTADEIAAATGRGKELDRKWSCFDLSGCRHTVFSLVEVGTWTVEVCEGCGQTETRCTHVDMEWNDEGTLLRCSTCGIDGT